MQTNKFINDDCLNYMKTLEDKSIDLVLTDPPYGIDEKFKSGVNSKMNFKEIPQMGWDKIPSKEYFDEIFRISKNQIIWGGNYFRLNPSRCFIVWDKGIAEDFSLAMCELAYTSFDKNAKIYRQSTPKDGKQHPTQKPVKLFEWCLKNYSNENDIILDCFSGSGTTAIACHNLNRKFICIEKDKEYFDKSVIRYEKHIQQIKMFA